MWGKALRGSRASALLCFRELLRVGCQQPLCTSPPRPVKPPSCRLPLLAANALSISRLVATPAVCWCLAGGFPRAGFALLGAAAATDALDGYVARRYGQETWVGSVLDTAADKALVAGVAGTLFWVGSLQGHVVAVVIARELSVVTLWALSHLRRKEGCGASPSERVQPSALGKIGMIVMAAYEVAFPSLGRAIPLASAVRGLGWTVCITTIASALQYVLRYRRSSGTKLSF